MANLDVKNKIPYTRSMTAISPSSKITFSDQILFREMQGEAVLLNIETGIYFGLDETGTATWNIMQKEKQIGKIADYLLKHYDVDPKTCREDLLKFITNLEKNGLIQVHEG